MIVPIVQDIAGIVSKNKSNASTLSSIVFTDFPHQGTGFRILDLFQDSDTLQYLIHGRGGIS